MNFQFLENLKGFEKLYRLCDEAEEFVLYKPNISVTQARKALEFIVKLIYGSCCGNQSNQMNQKNQSYNDCTMFDMVSDQRFIRYINDETVMSAIHYIRKMGNVAAHDAEISETESVMVLEYLQFLTGEVCILLGLIDDYEEFAAPTVKPIRLSIIPDQTPAAVPPALAAEYGPRLQSVRFDVTHKRDETENKKLFLSASIREADWKVVTTPNESLPCCAGVQVKFDGLTADYVFYGKDNRPLAVVKFDINLIAARLAVVELADKLEEKLSYKPIAYYTNGYEVHCIDQLGFPPRRVFNFHCLEELELLRQRAGNRIPPHHIAIDDAITNRPYQKEAIGRVCKAFESGRRSSLLVMATGTGKTRVAISLSDIMTKSNWVKNILFLADRTSLVRQAQRNFTKLLPQMTTSIYTGQSGENDKDGNARIIFSTYQTMMNLVDEGSREFGIGRFDLIIIDEAHRSIFKKYGSLFHYFDAMKVGLTATPREEENKNTYDVFHLPDKEPDFAYELEEAVNDGYLVGYAVLDRTTNLMKRGIRYCELSSEEREEFDNYFSEEEEEDVTVAKVKPVFSPTEGTALIDSRYINRTVFNMNTIDIVLSDLMENGLKIDGGDKLGKTIIFAVNHRHADLIVKRFREVYSNLDRNYAVLIDSSVKSEKGNGADAQDLLDKFSVSEGLPQIAVSVDMLDTGIDVPEVLNLVFFKGVKSKIKFLQMIGRGTRPCSNLFGPENDKAGFLIFDYYDNFRYFGTDLSVFAGEKGDAKKKLTAKAGSVTEGINFHKLDLLSYLQQRGNRQGSFEEAFEKQLREEFIREVRELHNDNLLVQREIAYVNKYRTAELWEALTNKDVEDLKKHVMPLLTANDDNIKIKSFDNLMYLIESKYEEEYRRGGSVTIRFGFQRVESVLTKWMKALLKLKTIPEIVNNQVMIQSMIDGVYILNEFSYEKSEQARITLRRLMTYVELMKEFYITGFDDELEGEETDPSDAVQTYGEKVYTYINADQDVRLTKIRALEILTDQEKADLEDVFYHRLGTQSDFISLSGNMPLLPYLRTQVGIAEEAVQMKFGTFLNCSVLDEMQLQYMLNMIEYAKENGDITSRVLLTVSPFDSVNVSELFGEKKQYIKQLLAGLHKPVM